MGLSRLFPSCILTHRGATGGPGKFAILELPAPQSPPDLREKGGTNGGAAWGAGSPRMANFPGPPVARLWVRGQTRKCHMF